MGYFIADNAVIHDADGNMTHGSLPGVVGFVDYTFDARNRLTAVYGTTYTYDAEDNRIAIANAVGTTNFVLDPHGDALPRVLVRTKPDGTVTRYVYGIGLLYQVDQAGNATYYHYDQSGSTIAMTNGTGAVTVRVEYSPFGTITHGEGTTDTPFLYAGQFGIQTEPSGLLYMRARYYSPELRRFINADPTGFGGGLNWYAYANNSPLMYVDPDGEHPVLAAMIVGAAIGVVSQGVGDLIRGEFSGWEAYAGAAFGGAVGGATAFVGGPLISGLASGAAGNFTTQSLRILNGQQSAYNASSFAFESGFGGVLGFGSGRLFSHGLPALSRHVGSWQRSTGRWQNISGWSGETLSYLNNVLRGNRYIASEPRLYVPGRSWPVRPDFQFQSPSGLGYFVEAKAFGGGLGRGQSAALGHYGSSTFRVEQWSSQSFGRIGGGFGGAFSQGLK